MMLTRPMPRHAARYFDQQFDAIFDKPRESRLRVLGAWLRLLASLVVCALIYRSKRVSFRSIDRFMLRVQQIVVTGAVVLLVAAILECVLSGVFAQAVAR